jgi:phosphoserine/homoserine phosphotransferase
VLEERVFIACLDLEGVLIPEIWIGLADRTGIDDLRVTTREIPDYDELMSIRLGLLSKHGLTARDLDAVVSELAPLDGARDFLGWLRSQCQVAILSDTFYELANPLMAQLGYPLLMCHRLDVDAQGRVTGYRLRQSDPKRRAVEAFQALNFRTVAAGDSYNDTTMLAQADAGILFCPPENVVREFPAFPVCRDYDELKAEITAVLAGEPAETAPVRVAS